MARFKSEDILATLKDLGTDGATSPDLEALLGRANQTVNFHLKKLMNMTPCHIYRELLASGKGYRYYYSEEPVEKSEPEMDQTPEPEPEITPVEKKEESIDIPDKELAKNAEGYSDPTAYKAIKRYDSRKGFVVGGIYNTYSNSPFMVIGLHSDTILGYFVETSLLQVNSDTEVSWVERNITYNKDIVYTVHVNWLNSIPYSKLNSNAQRNSCSMDIYNEIIKKSPLRNSYVIEDNSPKIDEAAIRKEERANTTDKIREDLCDILKVPLDTSLESIEIRIAGLMDAVEKQYNSDQNSEELKFYKMVYGDLMSVLKARV